MYAAVSSSKHCVSGAWATVLLSPMCYSAAAALIAARLTLSVPRYRHDIGVTWHFCDYTAPDTTTPCQYKAKTAKEVKSHKMQRHDIGVQWHHCKMEGCEFKAKTTGNVKQHMSHTHNVNVVWHFCSIDGCTYKAKTVGNINR